MKTQMFNSVEDCQWLRETHLKGVSLPLTFRSFILEGNEDCPQALELFAATDPLYTDVPVRYELRDDDTKGFHYVLATPSPSVTVTDRAGNSHSVIAAKRRDSFRVLVVREWHGQGTPYVVHTFNEQDGGFHHGHYCETLERAMEVFNGKE